MAFLLATLMLDEQRAHAQKFFIPDYQTREQPDGCLAAPAEYGPPPYSIFRDTEDYTYLRDPKRHDDPFDPIKYIPLNADGTTYLSFGGEIRERWEYYSKPPLGQGPQDENGYYLQRYMLNADLHVGDTFRLFTQFKSDLENDRNGGPRPSIDEDKANIHQAYLDINFPPFDGGSFTLRLGRQELAYGIGRLIDPREGPNVRQSFDGAKAILHAEQWEIDGFATRLAETNEDQVRQSGSLYEILGRLRHSTARLSTRCRHRSLLSRLAKKFRAVRQRTGHGNAAYPWDTGAWHSR